MEFMTGVKKKEDISVKTLLETPEGTEVKLEGAVHIIRDMGEVAFVILRKSEGLVQCVYEEGSVDFRPSPFFPSRPSQCRSQSTNGK